jgi:MSHA biogenesis protein MshI
MGIGEAMGCTVEVIDIQDMAQRNLQSAWTHANATLERAHAALVVTEDHQAVLTISAYEELFYSRRIEVGAGFVVADWGGVGESVVEAGLGVAPADSDRMQRLVVEIQRSLDLWDRTWPMLSLDSMSVYAGDRSDELARRLAQELGQAVNVLDVSALFPGFDGGTNADRLLCWPLLGSLMRTQSREL